MTFTILQFVETFTPFRERPRFEDWESPSYSVPGEELNPDCMCVGLQWDLFTVRTTHQPAGFTG
jgi:hypothetical protein